MQSGIRTIPPISRIFFRILTFSAKPPSMLEQSLLKIILLIEIMF